MFLLVFCFIWWSTKNLVFVALGVGVSCWGQGVSWLKVWMLGLFVRKGVLCTQSSAWWRCVELMLEGILRSESSLPVLVQRCSALKTSTPFQGVSYTGSSFVSCQNNWLISIEQTKLENSQIFSKECLLFANLGKILGLFFFRKSSPSHGALGLPDFGRCSCYRSWALRAFASPAAAAQMSQGTSWVFLFKKMVHIYNRSDVF